VKTCRNCALGKRLSSEHCDFRNYPSHPNWRPRPWVPVLICALVGLALTIAMCVVIAVKDQERIDAIPRAEPRVIDEMVFYYDGYQLDFHDYRPRQSRFAVKPLHKILTITFYSDHHYTVNDNMWWADTQ
jgi:hypothetical protein